MRNSFRYHIDINKDAPCLQRYARIAYSSGIPAVAR